jgi:hypothetical protein
VQQIAVDGLMGPGLPDAENWGELLDSLEHGDGASRRVVTAVRFGGVAVPTFRTPSALERKLSVLGRIEIETASVDELLHNSAQAAYESIPPLQRAAKRIAGLFRDSPDKNQPGRDLSQLTASLHALASVTALLASADPNHPATTQAFERLMPRLTRAVDDIIARQHTGDWVALGDVLERDLSLALDDWAAILRHVWNL